MRQHATATAALLHLLTPLQLVQPAHGPPSPLPAAGTSKWWQGGPKLHLEEPLKVTPAMCIYARAVDSLLHHALVNPLRSQVGLKGGVLAETGGLKGGMGDLGAQQKLRGWGGRESTVVVWEGEAQELGRGMRAGREQDGVALVAVVGLRARRISGSPVQPTLKCYPLPATSKK